MLLTILAITLSCLGIAAVIDVSSPSIHLEPGRDARSVADGVLAAMDRSADPCDDFYEYSCGSWLRSSKIPSDRTTLSKSFYAVFDRVRLLTKDLLEGPLQTTKDQVTSKAAVFYASCIDQIASGPLNTLFLSPYRDDFNSLKDLPSFVRLFARLQAADSISFFNVYIGPDDKDPSRYAIFLGQGGFGLPHRDNYLNKGEHDVEVRRRYKILIVNMLSAAGRARLLSRKGHTDLAERILSLETTLAKASKPPSDMRDPEAIYNRVDVSSMDPSLHMSEFFSAAGIDTRKVNGSIVLDNPNFFKTTATIMKTMESKDEMRKVVRGYLAFHLARIAARDGLIGEKAYIDNFKFQQFLYGIKNLPERWKACIRLTDKHLGEAVGKAFVENYFTEKQMNVAFKLAKAITASFSSTLKKLDWMDAPTKAKALEKLKALKWKVGYSKKLDKYEDVSVSRNNFQANIHSTLEHMFKKTVNHLGNPVDDTTWEMNPQEVNAYYSPVRNEMVFPAGILQPPFFSDAYPDAMNYGGIGAVVGHEMSHGFDDEGRKYNKDGLLTPWWSRASALEYDRRAKCTVELYDTFKPRDVNIHVLGNLTIGENIADTNGVNVAYRAFKNLPNNTKDAVPPPNALLARELTNDQLFFVAYAQNWCTLYRPEALKLLMMTDPHSPGKFRTLGPLSQSPVFSNAYSCKNGSRYNPPTRCKLW